MQTLVPALVISLLLGALGLRVLMRSQKSGTPTEGLVGLFFVGIGVATIPALLASDSRLFPGASSQVAMAFGHLVLSIGFGALYVFVWRCFGAGSSARRVAALLGCTALAGLYILQAVTEQFVAPGGAAVRATALVRAGALLWALSESLRYWLMMRRRVRLGLTDPLVANRFLLWCLWMGGMLGAIGVVITARFLEIEVGPGTPLGQQLLVILPTFGLALASGFSLWLAFFPPDWYAARFAARKG